jgi:hypothetical protein
MAGPRGPRRHIQGRVAALALAVCAAFAIAACDGTRATSSLAPINALPTPLLTEFPIDTTVWVSGFVVTVQSATAALDSKGGPVTARVTIENPGDEASLDVPISLVAGDKVFELAPGTQLPLIVSGGVASIELEFEVLGRPSIDDGVIRIGRDADHAAMIPLRPDTSQLEQLEPRAVAIKGTGRAGTLRVTLKRLELRWDLPDWHDELPLESAALTLTYDVTYTGDFAGGASFTADNVTLKLPDGRIVSPRADGHSQTIALLHGNRTMTGLSSRFEIPDGMTGTFALVVHDGASAKSIPFTVEP